MLQLGKNGLYKMSSDSILLVFSLTQLPIVKLASLFLKITSVLDSGGTSMLLLMIVEYSVQSISIQLSFAAA